MVYKNFLFRLFFSLIFISIYLILSFINFNYVFYLILVIYALTLLEIYIYFKKFRVLPIIYILISLFFFINLDFKQLIFLNFNLFIFIVVTFDIFSYFTGKFFGKNKLIRISPNKTIEGLCGGILVSFSLSIIFAYLFKIEINYNLIFFILLIIITAFLGDIIESYYKRKNDLKNSSKSIPGHGGIFDRFDSFFFSIIFYSISIII